MSCAPFMQLGYQLAHLPLQLLLLRCCRLECSAQFLPACGLLIALCCNEAMVSFPTSLTVIEPELSSFAMPQTCAALNSNALSQSSK